MSNRKAVSISLSYLKDGGLFFSYLDYKLKKQGGKLIKVDPKHTSQTCPVCGYKSKNNRKSQAVFCCEKCGYTANADLVASVNILKKALGKENPITLPQALREVTPVEYARVHTRKQELVGNQAAEAHQPTWARRLGSGQANTKVQLGVA